jgi:molybdopterin synthase sulfur carrier subunit
VRVKALLFAHLRAATGRREIDLDLPPGATIRTAAEVLGELFPQADLRGVMVAVNERYADPNVALADGDVVAFLPPVSGG